MFEINSLEHVREEILHDTLVGKSSIYVLDNFYKNPDEVVGYLQSKPPTRWKANETPTYNGVHFHDLRHRIMNPEIEGVYQQLSQLCGQEAFQSQHVLSNISKFEHHAFNDFQNNYWWPHLDLGYTAIVYLNGYETGGTNLYKPRSFDDQNCPEHYAPWRPREKWELKMTLMASYNRLVMFNGGHIHHGMSVEDETFFGDNWRANQVFFFKNPDPAS
ncbi:MAG: hypothetical protein K0U93_17545 [Gammaproteobacteria bacterium]|nr:hypothetical protein [Gammaproteobacteria bacterium]